MDGKSVYYTSAEVSPVYTRPAGYNGWKVSDVLLSSNHAKIREWQEKIAYERTQELWPELLK